MKSFTTKPNSGWSLRLGLVCFSAISVSLPIAWISLAKVLVVLVGLGYLLYCAFKADEDRAISVNHTSKLILAIILAFFLSLLWTPVDLDFALIALVKHAKLIVVVLLIALIRTDFEARVGLSAFVAGQSFLLLSSWLLFLGVPVPWVIDPTGKYVIFSTYIDQSVMFATTAGLVWHLRSEDMWPRWSAAVFAVGAIAACILLLEGRTGYLVAIAVVTMALLWLTPKKLRFVALFFVPIVVFFAMYLSSSLLKERITTAVQESQNYSTHAETESSSGWRLNAWQMSLKALAESPAYGHGVGSWASTVKRLQGPTGVSIFGSSNASNPHQEYLLWGVELGLVGVLLFLGLLVCAALDSKRFNTATQRAILSTIAALAVASLFNSVLYDDLIGDYFCVALGLLLAFGFRGATPPPQGTLRER
jgi:O-antigen ligase